MFACNSNNSKIYYPYDVFYNIIINMYVEGMLLILFLYRLFFLVLSIVYLYESSPCYWMHAYLSLLHLYY